MIVLLTVRMSFVVLLIALAMNLPVKAAQNDDQGTQSASSSATSSQVADLAKKAAVDAAANTHASFSHLSRGDLDPSAANIAKAQQLAADPVFSASELSKRTAVFDKEARAALQPGIDRQNRTFQDAIHSVGANASVNQANHVQHDDGPPAVYRVYVSRSMDPGVLKSIVEMARDHQDMDVVFRGLLPGEKINQLAVYLGSLAHLTHDGPLPRISLNPVAFREHHVTVVPTLEKLDRKGNVIASVRGLTSITWLDDQIKHGAHGDLGKYGPVLAIAEEDIEEVLKRQLAKIDLKGAARKSLQAFWSRQPTWPLTRATRDRTRQVDPSVTITDAITAPDGRVLAYPGQRLNPMDVMPFNLVVIVIDVRDPSELKFAASMVKHLGVTPVMVITTAETDWQSYQDHVVALGVPVYTLKQDIVDRFALEHIPSVVVSGKNKMLEVREYALLISSNTKEVADAAHNGAAQ